MERRRTPASSYAYDLLRWKELWIPATRGGKVTAGAPRRQPVSMPTHLTAAMSVAVRLILEEGLPRRVRRHEVAAGALRAGLAAMQLDMKTPRAVDPAAVVARMRDQYGILIGTGLAEMRTTTLRIGTMGMTASPMYVLPTLSALELALRDLGAKCEPGAGVAAAQAAFADAA
jgi:aspartate aminotransferase-like enzyme